MKLSGTGMGIDGGAASGEGGRYLATAAASARRLLWPIDAPYSASQVPSCSSSLGAMARRMDNPAESIITSTRVTHRATRVSNGATPTSTGPPPNVETSTDARPTSPFSAYASSCQTRILIGIKRAAAWAPRAKMPARMVERGSRRAGKRKGKEGADGNTTARVQHGIDAARSSTAKRMTGRTLPKIDIRTPDRMAGSMRNKCAVLLGPRRRISASTMVYSVSKARPHTYVHQRSPTPDHPDDRRRPRRVNANIDIGHQSGHKSESNEYLRRYELEEMSTAACQRGHHPTSTRSTHAGVIALSRNARSPLPLWRLDLRERDHALGSAARIRGWARTAPGVVW